MFTKLLSLAYAAKNKVVSFAKWSYDHIVNLFKSADDAAAVAEGALEDSADDAQKSVGLFQKLLASCTNIWALLIAGAIAVGAFVLYRVLRQGKTAAEETTAEESVSDNQNDDADLNGQVQEDPEQTVQTKEAANDEETVKTEEVKLSWFKRSTMTVLNWCKSAVVGLGFIAGVVVGFFLLFRSNKDTDGAIAEDINNDVPLEA